MGQPSAINRHFCQHWEVTDRITVHMIKPGDQPTSVPYLNVVPVNEPFGSNQGGGIIWVIAQKPSTKTKRWPSIPRI